MVARQETQLLIGRLRPFEKGPSVRPTMALDQVTKAIDHRFIIIISN
jgi:hypothetical protein